MHFATTLLAKERYIYSTTSSHHQHMSSTIWKLVYKQPDLNTLLFILFVFKYPIFSPTNIPATETNEKIYLERRLFEHTVVASLCVLTFPAIEFLRSLVRKLLKEKNK
jgi:hypothetical protein